jgi:hypothetical protein
MSPSQLWVMPWIVTSSTVLTATGTTIVELSEVEFVAAVTLLYTAPAPTSGIGPPAPPPNVCAWADSASRLRAARVGTNVSFMCGMGILKVLPEVCGAHATARSIFHQE